MATYTFQNGDTYPYFPTSIEPISFAVQHVRTTVATDPRSRKLQTRSYGGVRIEARLSFPPLQQSDYAELTGFLNQIDGRNTLFALKWPTMVGTASNEYNYVAGEYYNRDTATLDNQLVRWDGTSIDPPARSGSFIKRRWSQSFGYPHLLCSLKQDAQQVSYGSNNFIRYDLAVVERWTGA